MILRHPDQINRLPDAARPVVVLDPDGDGLFRPVPVDEIGNGNDERCPPVIFVFEFAFVNQFAVEEDQPRFIDRAEEKADFLSLPAGGDPDPLRIPAETIVILEEILQFVRNVGAGLFFPCGIDVDRRPLRFVFVSRPLHPTFI